MNLNKVEDALDREYGSGLTDGMLMLLDRLQGRGNGAYMGEMPEELKAFLLGVRARLLAS